jgi:hypothetical protein
LIAVMRVLLVDKIEEKAGIFKSLILADGRVEW